MINMAQNKTKKVLMKTSHCNTPNGRLDYAKVENRFTSTTDLIRINISRMLEKL